MTKLTEKDLENVTGAGAGTVDLNKVRKVGVDPTSTDSDSSSDNTGGSIDNDELSQQNL